MFFGSLLSALSLHFLPLPSPTKFLPEAWFSSSSSKIFPWLPWLFPIICKGWCFPAIQVRPFFLCLLPMEIFFSLPDSTLDSLTAYLSRWLSCFIAPALISEMSMLVCLPDISGDDRQTLFHHIYFYMSLGRWEILEMDAHDACATDWIHAFDTFDLHSSKLLKWKIGWIFPQFWTLKKRSALMLMKFTFYGGEKVTEKQVNA